MIVFCFYKGKLSNKDVVVVKCGIGKVLSSSITTLLITHFNVDRIINIGICGGIVNKIHEKEFLLVEKASYSDVEGLTNNYGQIQDYPLYFETDSTTNEIIASHYPEVVKGNILTGDKFVTNYEYVQDVMHKYQNHNFHGVDMESAAIAHICYAYNVKVNIIRYISDVVGKEFQMDEYFANKEDCSYVLIEMVNYLLSII